jgi:hypothetical protein
MVRVNQIEECDLAIRQRSRIAFTKILIASANRNVLAGFVGGPNNRRELLENRTTLEFVSVSAGL